MDLRTDQKVSEDGSVSEEATLGLGGLQGQYVRITVVKGNGVGGPNVLYHSINANVAYLCHDIGITDQLQTQNSQCNGIAVMKSLKYACLHVFADIEMGST